jgi:hypothetical protein
MKAQTKAVPTLFMKKNLQRILKTSSAKNNLTTIQGVILNWPFFISCSI